VILASKRRQSGSATDGVCIHWGDRVIRYSDTQLLSFAALTDSTNRYSEAHSDFWNGRLRYLE